MDKREAQNIAIHLMNKYGLTDWTFEFNSRKTALGICRHRLNIIGISSYLLPSMSLDVLTNTVLHEIAHALVGSGHGHDFVWRRKAREIGCSAERTTSIEVDENKLSKYSCQCPDCLRMHHKHRKPKRPTCCICLGRFDGTRTLDFVQNY
jgi:predicted SprT family Zn-dependent metalloprotease